MQAERWKRIEDLYQAAVAQPPERRAEFIEQACPGDPQLRAEVESLLKDAGESTSFLGDLLPFAPGEAAAGAVIGVYHLLEPIGRGGMGEVWLAEQKQPVRRRVALKLIKAGMDTREVVARFESERRALALMDHPAIARVFDAGSTPHGRPYFAMEYVTGMPITHYCDQRKLTVRQRLELFVLVCDGVQHAHQKAIVHRDLKPSNILVGELDGKPAPRIIDFGVAKATAQRLTADTTLTRVGAIIGTPGYMSPEQADSAGVDVDTRTDVYSLGVVLYELLVGALPLDFRGTPADQFLHRLREEDAPPPSTRLRTLGDRTGSTARNRGVDGPTLARHLRGDLDAIALKALEKDRSRRYATPSELAADIGRYLRHEPVLARPASTGYRAWKYVRRHRLGVAFAAVLAILLVAGLAATSWMALRASRAEREAEAVNSFLQNDLLAQAGASKQSNPGTKPDPDLKVRTALDRAAARVAGKFDRQPEVEAAIRDTIGQTYVDLGLFPEARTQLQRALELRRRVLGPKNAKTLISLSHVGRVAYLQGKYPEAEALHKQALAMQSRVLGSDDPETLASMHSLAVDYVAQGKWAQGEALQNEALKLRRRVLGPEHPDTLRTMGGLAANYYEQGKYDQAVALYNQTLGIQRRVLGPEHPETLASMHNLATVYIDQGKYADAETLYSQTLEVRRRVLGLQHPETLTSMGNLAFVYIEQGKYAQAETLQHLTLETQRHVLGPEHPDTLISATLLGEVYCEQGKYAQAGALFTQNLEIQRRVLGPGHPYTLTTLADIASLYRRERKFALAETNATQVLATSRKALGNEHWFTMVAMSDLALVYQLQEKFAQSEPLAREAVETYRKQQPDDWQRYRAESLLGASLAGQKKYAEAEPLLLAGYQGMTARKDKIAVPDRYHLDRAHEWLVQLYTAWGKPDKAAEWRRK